MQPVGELAGKLRREANALPILMSFFPYVFIILLCLILTM
jgi:hypothetical protein